MALRLRRAQGRSPEVTLAREDGTDHLSGRGFDVLNAPADHWQEDGGKVVPAVSGPDDRGKR